MKMTVRYVCSCHDGATASVELEERAADEDLPAWMVKLQTALALDHRARSPNCQERSLARVEIPTTRGALVGRITPSD